MLQALEVIREAPQFGAEGIPWAGYVVALRQDRWPVAVERLARVIVYRWGQLQVELTRRDGRRIRVGEDPPRTMRC